MTDYANLIQRLRARPYDPYAHQAADAVEALTAGYKSACEESWRNASLAATLTAERDEARQALKDFDADSTHQFNRILARAAAAEATAAENWERAEVAEAARDRLADALERIAGGTGLVFPARPGYTDSPHLIAREALAATEDGQ